jgi:hypothetical protein
VNKSLMDRSDDSPPVTHAPVAGTDLTTGHAVDAFLIPGVACDPWAGKCFATFADILINYSQTLCPLPSKSASENLVADALPLSINAARERDLLRFKVDETAEAIVLPSQTIQTEYDRFVFWARSHQLQLRAWVEYHFNTDRIRRLMPVHIPHSPISDFWGQRRNDVLGIEDFGVKHAFDMYIRAVQYHSVLGPEVAYFSHPIRRTAIAEDLSWEPHRNLPSWGRYLGDAIETKRIRRDPNEVLDTIASIKSAVHQHGATWHSLMGRSDLERKALIETVASEAKLPARLRESARQSIVMGVSAASVALGSSLAPQTEAVAIVVLALGIGNIVAQKWEGRVPGALCKLCVLKGSLEWPGLTR